MKLYKIRNKVTGLFSKGGTTPTFNKVGKTWNTLGHLKSHLMSIQRYRTADMMNWEILEIEVLETLVPLGLASDMLAECTKKAHEADAKRQLKYEREMRKKNAALNKLSPEERKLLNL